MSEVIELTEAILRKAKSEAGRQANALKNFKAAILQAEDERAAKRNAAMQKYREAGELAREAAEMLDAAEREHTANIEEIGAQIDIMVSRRIAAARPSLVSAGKE